ncbi:hypothetical protein [Sphingomonas crusticola]|nr:hypothetical protein [Sphingomonas crusticola]
MSRIAVWPARQGARNVIRLGLEAVHFWTDRPVGFAGLAACPVKDFR